MNLNPIKTLCLVKVSKIWKLVLHQSNYSELFKSPVRTLRIFHYLWTFYPKAISIISQIITVWKLLLWSHLFHLKPNCNKQGTENPLKYISGWNIVNFGQFNLFTDNILCKVFRHSTLTCSERYILTKNYFNSNEKFTNILSFHNFLKIIVSFTRKFKGKVGSIQNIFTHALDIKYFEIFQGCLPKAASIASDYTSLIILAIISILTLEIVVIILACCLCMLQKYRSEKICHTVIVKKEPSSSSWSRGCHPDDKNNWHQSRVQDEHKNLIYNDMRNDIIVPW